VELAEIFLAERAASLISVLVKTSVTLDLADVNLLTSWSLTGLTQIHLQNQCPHTLIVLISDKSITP